MRNLKRNQILIHYAEYDGMTPIIVDGLDTGEKEITYKPVKSLRINVSPPQGKNVTNAFGDFANFTKIMSTTDKNLTLDEQTILWVDESDFTQPYDYVIERVASSLNSTLYAIRKVR